MGTRFRVALFLRKNAFKLKNKAGKRVYLSDMSLYVGLFDDCLSEYSGQNMRGRLKRLTTAEFCVILELQNRYGFF